MEVSGQLHTPVTLQPPTPGKNPWYPLDMRLCGLQSLSGNSGEEKDTQPLPGLKPPVNKPVAQRYLSLNYHFHVSVVSDEGLLVY
jgi:hypothetical protein